MEHQYILEPYKGIKSRHTCPECSKDKTFSLYIHTASGLPIARNVGRCNRETSCSYHYTPRQYFQDNSHTYTPPGPEYRTRIKKVEPLPFSYIHPVIFKKSLTGYSSNTFTEYLSGLFGNQITSKLISRHFIGSSKKRFKSKDYPEYESELGATVFWQIDYKGRIRTGKIMLYSPVTGKRIKEPFNHITWVHSQLKEPGYNLRQCLFGEHLLKAEPAKPVSIVESEKTAIIAGVYYPESVWLAAGSLNNLNKNKCLVLSGRKVTLYPDLNSFDKWNIKAKELSSIASIQVSDLLEKKATQSERQQGLDLADYLLRFDYSQFAKEPDLQTVIENVRKPEISIIPVERLIIDNIQEKDTGNTKSNVYSN